MTVWVSKPNNFICFYLYFFANILIVLLKMQEPNCSNIDFNNINFILFNYYDLKDKCLRTLLSAYSLMW